MLWLEYELEPGGYINRMTAVGAFERKSPFPKTVLHGKVNEWLIKGLSVYDNPARKEVLRDRRETPPPCVDISSMLPGDALTVFGQERKLEVSFPFESDRISRSGFYEMPAWLRSYACTFLEAREAEVAQLELFTCGSVTLWLNGEQIADFAPFVRNTEQHTTISAALKKGENKLIVCFEELAERDTDYYFRLRYLGKQKLRMRLRVKENTDTDAVKRAEHALSQMYFEKEAYLSEPVVLKLEPFSDEPVEAVLTPDRFTGPKRYRIEPGQRELTLFEADEAPSSFYFFRMEVCISGLTVSRVIGTYCFNTQFMNCGGNTFEERKRQVWSIIRNTPDERSDYRLILRMLKGETPDNIEEILSNHLAWVNEKRDCSDFRMMILICIYGMFRDRLPVGLREEMEEAFAEYRYWIDEPGDDVMWFFSENHALMFHICEYFAGKFLPDRIFTAGGITGKEASAKAERLLDEWFDRFFREFVTEWNSSTYLPIDVMGLAYLYDLEPEGSVLRDKAEKALDMLAFYMAVNEHKGNIMTSFGRTYERELKGSYSTGMPSLLYLFYNAGHMNDHFRALVPIVAGSYRPPEEYAQYTGLREDEELIHQNTQGIGRFVNLYLYKNSRALLSTAVGFHPFEQGYQENIVQATLDGTAQVFLNHPGEAEIYGTGRPGFWAGNGSLPFAAQYENVSIALFHIGPDCRMGITHAYAPLSEFDSFRIGKNAAALEKNGGFIGIRAANGITMQTEGPCRRRELISPGRDNVWVIKVGRYGQYRDVDELLEEMERMDIRLDETVHVTDGQTRYEIRDNTLLVNGKRVHHYPLDVAGELTLSGGRWKKEGEKNHEYKMSEGI